MSEERKKHISVLKNMLEWMEAASKVASKEERKEAVKYAISSLETDEAYQLEYEKPKLCEDCVPREVVRRIITSPRSQEQMLNALNSLQSVIPESESNAENCISRKEAISWIENLRTLNEHYHPNAKDNHLIDCDSAIDHLKQVPSVLPKQTKECEDCISRKEVDRLANKYLKEPTDNHVAFYEQFLDLPSVLPKADKPAIIDWNNCHTSEQLDSISTTKNDLGVDKEERELALMYLEQIKEDYIEGVGYERHPLPEYYAIETAIKSLVLPSVTPQESIKKCKWIKYDYRTICPEGHDINNPYWRIPENRMEALKYCPYCGKEIEVEE